MSRNDDLEFISVSQNDDDFAMNSANRTNFDSDSTVDSVIGSTFLKFSKVLMHLKLYYAYI